MIVPYSTDVAMAPRCDRNARLVEGVCVCRSGYRGDGLTCTGESKDLTIVHGFQPEILNAPLLRIYIASAHLGIIMT